MNKLLPILKERNYLMQYFHLFFTYYEIHTVCELTSPINCICPVNLNMQKIITIFIQGLGDLQKNRQKRYSKHYKNNDTSKQIKS